VSFERRVLFSSGAISVVDFRCREHGDREGPEEPNETHSIALVRRGIFRRTTQGRAFIADANHILFFNEDHGYRFSHPVPGGDDCTILTIATPLALEIVARHAPRDAERPEAPFRVGHGVTSTRTRRLHYELLRATRQPASELAIEDVLAELGDEAVHDAYQQTETATPVQRRHREVTEAAKLVLNRRVASPPSLHALARSLDCSPFHLSRVFHATAGVSLRRYLGRLRAGIAADRLARGADDLTDLALSLGYADHSHFTNAFRQEFGVAPSQFRKNLKSQ
jgi:AraC-like DNA-binding protein